MPSVTIDELTADKISAEFWTTHTNLYSDQMQKLADRYAIAAGLISAITGLTAFGNIVASAGRWQQIVVVLMAFTSAAVALIPKVRHYNECALDAKPLAGEYGEALGELRSAISEVQSNAVDAQKHAHDAVVKFQAVKRRGVVATRL